MSNISQTPVQQGNQATPVKQANRLQLILMIGAAAIVIGFTWLFTQKPEQPPAKDTYYTGVMYNFRNGKWVDGNGRVVPPPAGQTAGTPAPMDTRRLGADQ